jgi:hypothetical protein
MRAGGPHASYRYLICTKYCIFPLRFLCVIILLIVNQSPASEVAAGFRVNLVCLCVSVYFYFALIVRFSIGCP